jgi:hypothetical protein
VTVASLHPELGARVVLSRQSTDESGARYTVDIYDPKKIYTTTAYLSGGGVRLEPWKDEPPGWAIVFAERMLGLVARKAEWPRKLTRWRDAMER